jgi:hypothetical protein
VLSHDDDIDMVFESRGVDVLRHDDLRRRQRWASTR